jgi:hypothetical protein
LSKRWNALSYHKVREAIAGGWLRFEHIPGSENPADIFTKPLPWHVMKNFVEPLLFWKGDTNDIPGNPNPEGSDAYPGRDVARQGNATGETHSIQDQNENLTDQGGNIPEHAGMHTLLWNNQYGVLATED